MVKSDNSLSSLKITQKHRYFCFVILWCVTFKSGLAYGTYVISTHKEKLNERALSQTKSGMNLICQFEQKDDKGWSDELAQPALIGDVCIIDKKQNQVSELN